MVLMAAVLIGLGYGIGYVIHPAGGAIGALIAGLIWIGLWATAVGGGAGLMLSASGAHEITHDDSPRLDNIVDEMTIASGLPARPKVYLIDSDVPNAFAVGTPNDAAVAVTTGLLMRLNRDELQGVVAHEIGHITNQDTRFMVLAGVMLGAIVLLADVLWRVVFVAGRDRRRSSSSSGGGQVMAVVMLVAIFFAILAPLLARILYFACSRKREYLADASSASFTRYPPGLASALEKISGGSIANLSGVNRVTAPMYIVNPLQPKRALTGLFSTHPPTEERIRILRSMAGGAGYVDYEKAFAQTTARGVIGARTLRQSGQVKARGPSAERDQNPLARTREAVDILHRGAGYLFLNCPCGLHIKVPPSFKQETLFCPRCSRRHTVPAAERVAASTGKEPAPAPPAADAASLQAHRQPGTWQAFRCACGQTVQLSPSLEARSIRCPGCRREIRLRY